MEGSSFSDGKVIEKLAAEFVAVKLNVTDDGWPEDVPALTAWQEAFTRDWRHKYGFATSVVIGPDGQWVYGTSGSGYKWEWETAINYHPDKYLSYLDECLDRFRRIEAILADASLSELERKAGLLKVRGEILAQLVEANKRGRKSR
mgnify:CR=1 FL=1